MEIVSFKYIIFMSHLTLEQMHDLSMGLVLLPLKGLSLCLALSTFKHFFYSGGDISRKISASVHKINVKISYNV